MTTPIDRPNRDAIIQAVDIFRDAMRPFIVRNLRSVHGKQAEDLLKYSMRGSASALTNFEHRLGQSGGIEGAIDLNNIPHIINQNWRDAFAVAFNNERSTQNMLWLIVDARNDASHPGIEDMDLQYVEARLTDIAEVLGRINEADNKCRVEDIRDRLRRNAESAPAQAPEPAPAPERPPKRRSRRSAASAGPSLKPWREVIRPNSDIVSGEFKQAEYAANLQKVHDGEAPTSYRSPVRFFEQTHITAGIRSLLVNTLKRISGNGGDPVILTRTGFGGGKTHSLIAIHHVVNEHRALLTPAGDSVGNLVANEIRAIITEAGIDPDAEIEAKVAVLDGNHLSPTDKRTNDNRYPRNTLWGEMAWQLGGQAAYDIIGAAARAGSAPGGAQLSALFAHVGPCVILMDEIVSYARNEGVDLDSIYTFVQNLTQSVSASENVALVVTLPESNREAGGERGQQALNTLGHTFARIVSFWTPLEVHEAYEVVRRRLFGAEIDEDERDRTCDEFHKIYNRQRREYPAGSHEPRYIDAMKDCYPIHPETFERLYNDWSSYPNFQRTRGVLRLMANWISRLYRDNDPSPLIMSANLPLSDPGVSGEFTQLLGQGQWQPVLSEADSNGSRADVIDTQSTTFMDMGGAARRLARTIFYGSARSGASVGVNTPTIMLGVMQPGHQVAHYKDALQRMSNSLYYLYEDRGRYYFHVEENLNKVAIDRAGQLNTEIVDKFIVEQLIASARMSPGILICPEGSADVPDTEDLRLIALHPDINISSRASEVDRAREYAERILRNRDAAPRIHKNALLFLTSRRDDIRTLRHAAERAIAWQSIIDDSAQFNLTGKRAGQARDQLNGARSDFDTALVKAYSRVLAPSQPNPPEPNYDFTETESKAPDTGELFAAAFDACVTNESLVKGIHPSMLLNMLDRYVWSGGATKERDHVGVGELWEMMRTHIYMHRLESKDTLREAVANGVRAGAFGYAASYHGGEDYRGMRLLDDTIGAYHIAADGIIVTRVMADLVIEASTPKYTAEQSDVAPIGAIADGPGGYPSTTTPVNEPPPRPVMRRIRASKTLTGSISTDDFADIRAEIVHNLNADGAEVEVEIIVRASKPDGFSENALRAARDNSAQLGLDIQTDE